MERKQNQRVRHPSFVLSKIYALTEVLERGPMYTRNYALENANTFYIFTELYFIVLFRAACEVLCI